MIANSPGSNQKTARRDDSPLALALVVVALAGVVAAIFYLWAQITPPSQVSAETFFPATHGAALVYRLTNADGSIIYRSRNVYRDTANKRASKLDINSFSALIKSAEIDVEKMIEHPNDLSLASTFPHHKHIPPNIKQHRVPAPGTSFSEPNLPFLVQEIIREYHGHP